MSACHCFCSVNHPHETGVCAVEATTTVSYNVPGFGLLEVDMCEACAQATRLAAEADRR